MILKYRRSGERFWTAPAKRSGDGAFGWHGAFDCPIRSQSGVALRLPPQSKSFRCGIESPGGCSQDNNGIEIVGGPDKDRDMAPRAQRVLPPERSKHTVRCSSGIAIKPVQDSTIIEIPIT
jgi:hypothetical protein